MSKSKIVIPRQVLLIEIERRCAMPECNARLRIGLTKAEAHAYCGFECEQCGEWNRDALAEEDAPEWWEELAITDLYSVREAEPGEKAWPSEVIARLSDNYRRTQNEE